MTKDPQDQGFRSAKTPQGLVVFPFPPIKGRKWLIKIQDENNLKEILKRLHSGELGIPIEDNTLYNDEGVHSDGQTPLYSLKNENFHS